MGVSIDCAANYQKNNQVEVCRSLVDPTEACFCLYMLIEFFGRNDSYLREIEVFFLKEPKNNGNYFVLNSLVLFAP